MNGGLFVTITGTGGIPNDLYFLSTHPLLQTLMKNIPSLKRTASLHLKTGMVGEYYGWWLKSGIHQLIWSIYHYLEGFIHPSWLFGISSINSSFPFFGMACLPGLCSVKFQGSGNWATEAPNAQPPPWGSNILAHADIPGPVRKDSLAGEFPSRWKRTKKLYTWWLNQPLWKNYDRQNGFIFPQFSGWKFQPARRPPERTGKFLLPKRPFSNLSFPWGNPCFSAVGFVCLCFFSLAWWVVYVV